MAGVLPRSSELSGLFLAAKPAGPAWKADVGPAAELQQQTRHIEESSGGSAAGAPESSWKMSHTDINSDLSAGLK